MSVYHNFIGIDIGKFSFTIACHGKNNVKEYENTSLGINAFFKEFNKEFPKSLIMPDEKNTTHIINHRYWIFCVFAKSAAN